MSQELKFYFITLRHSVTRSASPENLLLILQSHERPTQWLGDYWAVWGASIRWHGMQAAPDLWYGLGLLWLFLWSTEHTT